MTSNDQVVERDLDEPAEGDPPQPLVVAVDFTAEVVRIALAELDGEIVHREEHPLGPLEDEEAWSWEVGGRISTAFARQGERRFALGIAVACPGMVDPITGRLGDHDGQAGWDGLAVVDAIRRHIDAPVVPIERTRAALRGETAGGAAMGQHDVLYVTLRGRPRAAVMVSGRIVDGGAHRAGELPALAAFDSNVPLDDEQLQTVAEVLADASALLDPAVVVLDGAEMHIDALGPVLHAVLDEIAPGVQVLRSALEEHAALAGALQAASIVAYEGERTA
jgi:predicted NBD/HSP70 family sugar kinase